MKKEDKILLLIDSVVNAVIGIILLCYPLGTGDYLGLPGSVNNFYPVILGAVLLSTGIASFIERKYYERGIRGLGLEGAITINIIASTALIIYLIFSDASIAINGLIILWFIGILVFIIGVAEIFRHKLFKKK